MSRSRGFTLIELMIVVVIVAILAAVAVPAYTDYIIRAKITEATSQLSDQRVKMEQWYQDNRKYTNTADTACGVTMPVSYNTANPTGPVKYFTFTCANSTNQAYTITATGGVSGAGGDSSMSGFVYTITETNLKATTMSGAAVTRGYSSNTNCWVLKKANLC